MCYDKFSKSYRFEMLSNYGRQLNFYFFAYYINHGRQLNFYFFAYYINGISVKLNKTCYKALQKITDR